jgi:hypothetical protein
MSTCRATFDMLGPNPRPTDLRGTHTCELEQWHEPPHVCPLCGARWVTERGQRRNRVVSSPGPSTPPAQPNPGAQGGGEVAR